MENLTTKQKIILVAIIFIMAIVIGIYGYISMQKEAEQTEIENNEILNEETEEKNVLSENTTKNIQTENTKEMAENSNNQIIIHITGAVKKTGILKLNKGSRIADAIEKAGGNKEDANLDEVNLAYVLEDGQKIYIPSKKDNTKKEYVTSESGNNVIAENATSKKGENKKVNINTATQSELENLPGVGESIASKIIEYREQNGKFGKIEDLQNVKGIGDAKFNNIKEHVTAQ